MTLAVSFNTYWGIALGIGLARRPGRRAPARRAHRVRSGASSARSTGCWRSRARSAPTRRNIPQLEATAPVLALIVDEAVIQDGYMNALTDGFGGR